VEVRIENIEAMPVRCPLGRRLRSSRMRRQHRDVVVTRLRTTDGLEGFCFNSVSGTHPGEVVRVIEDEIAPALRGVDLFATERSAELAYRATYRYQRDWRVIMRARACVDSAQWDAIGKSLQRPLYEVWGGANRPLPVIVWGGATEEGKTLADFGREIEQIRASGAGGCKFKVGYLSGQSPAQDAERLRVAREAGGPDFLLIADANQGWTLAEAREFARHAADLDLLWIEEPCRWPNDHRDLAVLRRSTGLPIAGGQMEITAEGCRDLMLAGAIDYCNFDASWGGGPTAWRRVAALAAAFGVRVTQHQEAQYGGHLVLSVPDGVALEIYPEELDPPYYQMLANRPIPRDGRCTLGTQPGWGMEIDWGFVDRYTLS